MLKYYKFIIKLSIFSTILFSYSANAFIFSIFTTLYNTLLGEANAWSIVTKQTAVSAHQIVKAGNESAKTFVQAINSLEQNARVVKAFRDFSPQFGQPLSMQCSAMGQTKAILHKLDLADNLQLNTMFEKFSTNTQTKDLNFVNKKLTIHSKYCSKHEQIAGVCQDIDITEHQNADTNIANILAKNALDETQTQIAKDFASKIITPKIDEGVQCNSFGCRASASGELSYNAYMAMAGYSLNHQISQRTINTDIKQ
jgi:hypothetical protein